MFLIDVAIATKWFQNSPKVNREAGEICGLKDLNWQVLEEEHFYCPCYSWSIEFYSKGLGFLFTLARLIRTHSIAQYCTLRRYILKCLMYICLVLCLHGGGLFSCNIVVILLCFHSNNTSLPNSLKLLGLHSKQLVSRIMQKSVLLSSTHILRRHLTDAWYVGDNHNICHTVMYCFVML